MKRAPPPRPSRREREQREERGPGEHDIEKGSEHRRGENLRIGHLPLQRIERRVRLAWAHRVGVKRRAIRERGLMNGFEFILREKLERRERQRQAALAAFARVSAAPPFGAAP